MKLTQEFKEEKQDQLGMHARCEAKQTHGRLKSRPELETASNKKVVSVTWSAGISSKDDNLGHTKAQNEDKFS